MFISVQWIFIIFNFIAFEDNIFNFMSDALLGIGFSKFCLLSSFNFLPTKPFQV